MTQPARRILVAEDESALLDFVSRNLKARGFQVLEAYNGIEALHLWEQARPDLLILDVMMPRLDGLDLCRRVREVDTVPIIILTALDSESDRVAALDTGADDYLTKPFGVEELLARVRAVLRRSAWAASPPPTAVRRFGHLEIDLAGHRVLREGAAVHLTPTEFALLEQLVLHPNKLLTHRMLLQSVWGSEYRDELEYLRVYMGRLRRKLERDPANPRYLQTNSGTGYRFVP